MQERVQEPVQSDGTAEAERDAAIAEAAETRKSFASMRRELETRRSEVLAARAQTRAAAAELHSVATQLKVRSCCANTL